AIPFDSLFLAVDQKIRIVIKALTGKYHRIIESLRQSIQVNFSNHGRLVAVVLEAFRKIILVPVEGHAVVYLSVDKTVFAGQHHRPTGGTDGVGYETACKNSPFLRQPIDIWRLIQPGP